MSPFRRLATAAAFAFGAAAALATGAAAQGRDPARITFFIWAGSNQGVVPTRVIEEYRRANPRVTIDILESNNALTFPRMVASRRTTPNNPLVHCGFFNVDSITKGDPEGIWTSFDPAAVPNMANVPDGFIRPERKGIGYMMSGIGILYNRNVVQTPPTSWTDLWSPANRGRVTMFDYDLRMMAIAARLNGGSEERPDAGFRIWGQNARNLRALVDSNDAVKNLLASGDAHMAPWFTSISSVWIEEGAPFAFAVPREGLIAFPLFLAMVDGVNPAQRAVCQDLINTLLSPENAGEYGRLTRNIPLPRNAVLTEEQRINPMLNPSVAQNAIILDYNLLGEVAPDWRERWDREVKFRLR
jgi:putative spermidine/putrescine transport system substrate-binding protein